MKVHHVLRRRTVPIAAVAFTLSIAFHGAFGAEPGGAAPEALEEEPIAYDPFERVNRGVYRFNQWFDRWILKPVAKGYDRVLWDPVQNAISRAFGNLAAPTVMLNDTLQGKWRRAGSDGARFVVNSTAGVLGFFDVASHMGLEPHDEDFGQTLGVWGVGEGPYLVLPIIGPRTLRDTAGLGVDIATDPITWVEDNEWRYGLYALRLIDTRARLLDTTDLVTEAAGEDTYLFVREAYRSRRRNLIYDGNPPRPEFFDDVESPQTPSRP
jgi:phospholipid-binding lipoprotein MlaA